MSEFVVKGGEQVAGAGGMVRSTDNGKTDYTLALDGVMFQRLALHLHKATIPPPNGPGYGKRNWLKAVDGSEEEQRAVVERANSSAFRHFLQWLRGDTDEDHAAAVLFNINLAETVRTEYLRRTGFPL